MSSSTFNKSDEEALIDTFTVNEDPGVSKRDDEDLLGNSKKNESVRSIPQSPLMCRLPNEDLPKDTVPELCEKNINLQNKNSKESRKDENKSQSVSMFPQDGEENNTSRIQDKATMSTVKQRVRFESGKDDNKSQSALIILKDGKANNASLIQHKATAYKGPQRVRRKSIYKASSQRYSIMTMDNTSKLITTHFTDSSKVRSATLLESWKDVFQGEVNDFSRDTYNFMLFTPICSSSYAIATIVFLIQVAIFVFVIMELTDFGNSENPLGVSPDVSIEVRISQAIGLVIATFTQEDVRTSVILLHHGYRSLKFYRVFAGQVTLPKYILSVFCRLLMGFMGLLATFLLMVTGSSVLLLFLNFTAIEFVSQLDDLAFLFCANGFFGKYTKDCAIVVTETTYMRTDKGRFKIWKRLFNNKSLMFLILSSMIILWGVIVNQQTSGSLLCDTVYAQFGDDFLPAVGTFSGYYDRVGHSYEERRAREIQGINNSREIGVGKFTFCQKHSFWAFNIHQTSNTPASPCDWLARSEKTTFSHLPLASSLRWIVRQGEAREVILQHMNIDCLDCKSNNDICGKKGVCGSENKCICNDGWYGIRCDFPFPCPNVEIDVRFNKFLGRRQFSSTYSLLRHDGSDTNGIVEAYNRPVYIYEYDKAGGLGFDIILFTGRRWVLFHTRKAEDLSQLIHLFSDNFHAFWSNWWKTSFVTFVSDPVYIGTPSDAVTPIGLKWYKVKNERFVTDDPNDQLLPDTTSIGVILLCTVCNNKTNPCFYDGVCNELHNNASSATCQCSLGSSGSLCQIPPVGNGKCDVFFNIPEFSYDGGDCCEMTCQSTLEYSCGEGVVVDNDGILAFGQIGYPSCADPALMSMISGSSTLSYIKERGYVKCGVGDLPGFAYSTTNGDKAGFEVDLCKAIAAAVLGNPDVVEFFETSSKTRFTDLHNDKFDVLLRYTTFTSQRDIFVPTLDAGFTFAASPYFYDGLKYAGISPFGSCADNQDWFSPQCLDLKLCVNRKTTWYGITTEIFPKDVIVGVDDMEAYFLLLNQGLCNAFAGESGTFLNKGFNISSFEVGQNVFSKEPLTAVTRQDDRIWSKFVSWIFEALIQAEQYNITKATAKDNGLAPTSLFGQEFANMFNNAIAANGNYGELYQKNLERHIPRGTGLNNINKKNTALIYSFPFGSTDVRGTEPILLGTIDKIIKRGTLHCGIRNNAKGFAIEDSTTSTWSGFEVDICKGIAAALFNGAENVRFFPVVHSSRFLMLQRGLVDILVDGVSHTLTREIKEPSTGKGFDFSPTYFYDAMRFAGPPPYGICADRLIFDNTTFSPDCPKTKICVISGTTWLDAMENSLKIPKDNILVVPTMEKVYEMLALGECNAMVGESIDVAKVAVEDYPANAYYVGENKYSLERLAVVSRSDDAQFSDFIRWLVFALFNAAENSINRETFNDMPGNVLLFGEYFSGMWQNIIKAVGNYDEIFERNLKGIVIREGANLINLNGGPQMLANVGVTKQA